MDPPTSPCLEDGHVRLLSLGNRYVSELLVTLLQRARLSALTELNLGRPPRLTPLLPQLAAQSFPVCLREMRTALPCGDVALARRCKVLITRLYCDSRRRLRLRIYNATASRHKCTQCNHRKKLSRRAPRCPLNVPCASMTDSRRFGNRP